MPRLSSIAGTILAPLVAADNGTSWHLFKQAEFPAPPVPFSTSNTDGLPSQADWNTFVQLWQTVQNSTEMAHRRAVLQDYAKSRAEAFKTDILANLDKLAIDGFDMVWPVDGYAGVAYGGLWAVLVELQNTHGITKVGNRMGAGGGAASTILTMAGSPDIFLKMHQIYELWFDGHPERMAAELLRDTGLTSAIYAEVTRNDAVFANIQKEAFIVSTCSPSMVWPKQTIFHGFKTREQLVAAGYSSGDASVHGATSGTVVNGTKIGSCRDGGAVTVFPADVANKNYAVLLYKTSLDGVTHPTPDSVDRLFKGGVDTAIAALTSPSLSASGSEGNMYTALPGPSGIVTATEFSKIAKVTDAQVINLATTSHQQAEVIV